VSRVEVTSNFHVNSMIKFRTKMVDTLRSTIFNLRRGRPFLSPQEDKEDGQFYSSSEGIIDPGKFQKINGKEKHECQ
jgi:hypothetical protein